MIFISYRIDDSNSEVARLEEGLVAEFGRDVVFRDQSGIQGGDDWSAVIQERLETCRVILVTIGSKWKLIRYKEGPQEGRLRLDDPKDWVRREVTRALDSEAGGTKAVVPILLDLAEMPSESWLQFVGLERLASKQALRLRTDDYETDLKKLIDTLRAKCPDLPPRPNPATASAARQAVAGLASPTLPPDYLQRLRDKCAAVELLGLKLQEGQAVRLSSVYVPLTTQVQRLPGESGDEEGSLTNPEGRGREPTPVTLLSLLNQESLYIAGGAGSGKSTFCRWVAWLACTGKMPETPVPPPEGYSEEFPTQLGGRLPLLVRLREFWEFLPQTAGIRTLTQIQLEESLRRWIDATKPFGLTWEIVEPHLRQGTLLLLLDGVDEVPLSHASSGQPSELRTMLLDGLTEAIPDWTERGNRVLLTSRPYGVGPENAARLPLRSILLGDLDPPLRELLVQRWFHCLLEPADEARQVASEMLQHVDQRDDLTPLTANPMLLTAICVVYHQGRRLPHDRYDVYDRIVDNVLFNRFSQDPKVVGKVRSWLAVIAWGMHTGDGVGEARETPQAEATDSEIDRMIQAYQQSTSWTEAGYTGAVDARDVLLTHSGLLLPQGEHRAGFYHLTIQDFLAAQRMLDLPDGSLPNVFREHGDVNEWRSTLGFAFGGQLARSTSPQRSVALVGGLIEGLTDERIGLACVVGDCLQILSKRGVNLKPEVEDRYREYCLAALSRETPLRARYDLGIALGYLGDPRIVTDLRDQSAFVEIAPGEYLVGDDELRKDYSWVHPETRIQIAAPFWLAKYPVTNSQYALFMTEGGYAQRAWWSDAGWQWRQKEAISEPLYWRDARWNASNKPVVGVSFWEAEAFANWAGGRLPTEQEWEAAARGPEGFIYPWGNDWEDRICNSRESELGTTSPVGMFPRSRSGAFGLDDMAGNVWEWCADFEGVHRAFRGGCWDFAAMLCRSAYRYRHEPSLRRVSLGFRVARSSAR
ncbi:MAG: SUMF1/EgtB/PvdO family nonheme iron enzyme [Planctomycetales bacterium]